jgi:16S rRNA processing protein RimM
MTESDRWVEVGLVARPHGVRGEVRVTLHNKDSEVLFRVDEVRLRLADGDEHEVSVDAVRPADQAVLMKLHSVDDRDRADEVRGARIFVRRSDFAPLEPGEFYACDVEGARVLIGAAGDGEAKQEGVVKELVNYPSVDVFVVDVDGARYEVPLVEMYVEKVDAEARVVTLKTLEGLEPSRAK